MAIRFLSTQYIDGSLGIGTANPQDELHLASSLPSIRLEDTDNNIYHRIRGNEAHLVLVADAGNTGGSSSIRFQVDADEKMRITRTGNVGINITPATSVVLDVKEPDASNDLILGLTAGTGSRAQIRSVVQTSTESALSFHTTLSSSTQERFRILNTGAFSLGNSGTNYGTAGQVLTSNGNSAPYWSTPTSGTITGSGTSGRLAKFTGTSSIGDSGISDASNAVAITINGNEEVGIGASPFTKLDVYDSSTSVNIIRARNNTQQIALGVNDASGGAFLFVNTNHALRFGCNGSEVARFTADGTLKFPSAVKTKKIELWSTTTNDYQFYGFGVESSTLVYSIYDLGDSHVFYAGSSSTSRNELMRIKGDGNVIVGAAAVDAAGSFSIKSNGIVRGVLASGTVDDTIINAISGVSNGFQITNDASNNQNYKFHSNGGGLSFIINSGGNVASGGIGANETKSVTSQGGQRTLIPKNSVKFLGNSSTGAIAITSPQAHTDSFYTIKGTIFEYNVNETFEFVISGYYLTTTWYMTTAYIKGHAQSGSYDRNFTVRFGRDSSNRPIVYIGETNSTWNYAYVYINEINYGWTMSQASIDTYLNGWTISGGNTSFSNEQTNVRRTNCLITNWSRNDDKVYYNLGNVGIGTNSPAEKLEVSGSIKSTSRAIAGGSTAGITLSYDTSNSIGLIETWTSKPIGIETAGVRRMTIDSSGDVGIGTTPETAGPTWRTLFIGSSLVLVSRQSVTGSDALLANNYYINSSNVDKKRVTGTSSRIYLDGDVLRFQNSASAAADSTITWSEPMRIEANGNVGIGTTNPGCRLTVQANTLTATQILSSTSEMALQVGNTTAQTGYSNLILYTSNGNGQMWKSGNNTGWGGATSLNIYNSNGQICFHPQGTANTVKMASTGPGLLVDGQSYADNGSGGYGEYNIVGYSEGSQQATIGAYHNGDGYANLNLTSVVSGSKKMWHISKRPSSSSNRLEYFFFDTTFYSRFIFTYLGDFHADGDIVAYSTTASDEKLKDNIEPIHNALDKVSKLNGVSFTWNCGSRKDEKDLGVIAQNVEKVLPELVREKESPYHDDQTIKTVDYEKLTAVLIEAVKELQQKVEKLEKKKCCCK